MNNSSILLSVNRLIDVTIFLSPMWLSGKFDGVRQTSVLRGSGRLADLIGEVCGFVQGIDVGHAIEVEIVRSHLNQMHNERF